MDTYRMEYTPLSDEQKEQMRIIKTKAQELEALLDSYVSREERSERSRCMAIGRTDIEKGIMMAVKAVTTKIE